MLHTACGSATPQQPVFPDKFAQTRADADESSAALLGVAASVGLTDQERSCVLNSGSRFTIPTPREP
jgi:hypothetical protein